jgi:hypothetical protein
MEDGLGPYGDRLAVRVIHHGEAVLATGGDLVQLVDHRFELSLDIQAFAIDEHDRADGHDVHGIHRGTGPPAGSRLSSGRRRVRRRRVSCLFLTCGLLEESSREVQTMSSSPDAKDVSVAEAEARYRWERLALYRARVHGGKPTSLARLQELERDAGRADAWARRVRGV